MIGHACTDPDTARRLIVMFTADSRRITDFYSERQYLIGLGIPEGFCRSTANSAGRISVPER